MTIETGGPAFPTAQVNINGVDEQDGISAFGAGMTLRDYFAAKAVQGLIANGNTDAQQMAKAAYIMADAMLKARQA